MLRRMDESLRREQTNTRTTGMERMNERRDGVRNPNKKKRTQIKTNVDWSQIKEVTGAVAVTEGGEAADGGIFSSCQMNTA